MKGRGATPPLYQASRRPSGFRIKQGGSGEIVRVEEPEDVPQAKPVPLQLKFWNWGLGSTSRYLRGTQILVTHFPYHGPYKASVHTVPPTQGPGDTSQEERDSEAYESVGRASLDTSLSFLPSSVQQPEPFPSYYDQGDGNNNGDTPSPPVLPAIGSYYRYPRPDADVPARSPAVTSTILLPYSRDIRETSRSRTPTFTATVVTTTSSLSPISPFVRVTSYSPTSTDAKEIRRRSGSSSVRYSRIFDLNNSNVNTSSSRGGVVRAHRGLRHASSRRARAHGGRGKPTYDRQCSRYHYHPHFTPVVAHEWSIGDSNVQECLQRFGIDEPSILRRDRRIRITCCREDARFIYIFYRIMYILEAFEEV